MRTVQGEKSSRSSYLANALMCTRSFVFNHSCSWEIFPFSNWPLIDFVDWKNWTNNQSNDERTFTCNGSDENDAHWRFRVCKIWWQVAGACSTNASLLRGFTGCSFISILLNMRFVVRILYWKVILQHLLWNDLFVPKAACWIVPLMGAKLHSLIFEHPCL